MERKRSRSISHDVGFMRSVERGSRRTGTITALAGLLLFGLILASCAPSAGRAAGRTTRSNPPNPSSDPAQITSFVMPSLNTLWVQESTGDVFYSSNGGTSWTKRTPSGWSQPVSSGPTPSRQIPQSVTSTSDWLTQLLPGGTVVVGQTANQGQAWQLSTLPLTFAQGTGPIGASFVNVNDGWASVNLPTGAPAESSDVFETTNGGQSWQLETTVNAAGPVEFVGPEVGFAAGTPASNALEETSNGGQTWQQASLPIPSGVQANAANVASTPTFTDSNHGFLYVFFPQSAPQESFVADMDETSDGGASWTQVGLPLIDGAPTAWSIVGPDDWFLVGQTSIMHTTNGGSTWSTVMPNVALSNVSAVRFVSDDIGVALMNASCPSAGASAPAACPPSNQLIRTSDGGQTWTPLPSPQ